jgi:5-methylcytosine-specific restriction protein A
MRGGVALEVPWAIGVAMKKFEPGKVYSRIEDLHEPYGGQQQGGISTPVDEPCIFLFSGESGQQYGYSDGWDEKHDIFVFTGEGQRGDMEFKRGNLAIRDHVQNGKSLLLFESLGKGRGVRFVDEFTCSTWDYRRGLDVEGKDRRTIVFHLVPIRSLDLIGPQMAPPVQPLAELRAAALAASSPAAESTEKIAKQTVYTRSKAVRDYVLARAKGVCESCREPAPFQTVNGAPYLETHHTHRVSDGGPDHPQFVGAVCPNCHSEIHFGVKGKVKNEELKLYLADIEL